MHWALWLIGGAFVLKLIGELPRSVKDSVGPILPPPGGAVSRWAPMVQEEIALQKGPVKASQVLGTMGHESGGNPRAMSYYRKKSLGDPPMPKGLTRKQKRAFMVANWSGHAYGLGQLIPETGAKFGGIIGAGYTRAPGGQPGDSYNPKKNIKGTVALLNYLLRRYNGDIRKVYAAYYAGEGAVKKRGWEHFSDYVNTGLKWEAKFRGFDS